jgi:hypothetical protein
MSETPSIVTDAPAEESLADSNVAARQTAPWPSIDIADVIGRIFVMIGAVAVGTFIALFLALLLGLIPVC